MIAWLKKDGVGVQTRANQMLREWMLKDLEGRSRPHNDLVVSSGISATSYSAVLMCSLGGGCSLPGHRTIADSMPGRIA